MIIWIMYYFIRLKVILESLGIIWFEEAKDSYPHYFISY